MKSSIWVGLALALALALAPAACAQQSGVDFCDGWVDESCQNLAACCDPEAPFDRTECRHRLTLDCQQRTLAITPPTLFTFDAAAARDCLPPISACERSLPAPDGSVARRQACANMLTGRELAGTWCEVDAQCERVGDFSICLQTDPELGTGLCVGVVVDDDTCSFADLQLHVCSDGKFCDLAAAEPPGAPATPQADFSAPCRSLVAEGQSCIDPRNAAVLLPCQPGLFCHVTGTNEGTCRKRKAAGEPCDPDAGVDDCQADLFCPPSGQGLTPTCQGSDAPSFFCVAPPSCGDGRCDAGEDPTTCAEDCDDAPSCQGCACALPIAKGGCADVCGATMGNAPPSTFCGGALADGRCAACVESICGFTVDMCTR